MLDDIDDELVALMEEPPHGINHGRVRTAHGWRDLETGEFLVRSPAFNDDLCNNYHGTEYGYRKMGCRCVLCRAYKAAANAAYREKKGRNS